MKKYLLLIGLFAGLVPSLLAQNYSFPVDTLLKTGPLNRRINVVLLPDGYTAGELTKFRKDADGFIGYLLGNTPFAQYRNYFNFFLIRVPSAESGATHPGTANDEDRTQPVETKNTYFGTSFDYGGIHRLLVMRNIQNFTNVMATNFPVYDISFLLVNTTYYGGSGGVPSTFSMHPSSSEIGIHEVGHTFGGLSDEYWAGPQYARELPNMTRTNDPNSIRWKNWLNFPRIGIFEYTNGGNGWYKPTQASCKMEYLGQHFCAVCRETLVDRMLSLVNPIEQVLPAANTTIKVSAEPVTFRVNLLKPIPNSLQVDWYLDDKPLSAGSDSVQVDASKLTGTTGKLTAVVFDSTAFSRSAFHRQQHVYSTSWSLQSDGTSIPFTISADRTALCRGDSVQLRATGCTGTVTWSSGRTGVFTTVQPAYTTSYSATCADNGSVSNAIIITVEVAPLAAARNTGPYYTGQTIELQGGGGDSYLWRGPNSFSATVQNPVIPNATLSHAGTYTVTVTQNGCQAMAVTTVVVNPITGLEPVRWQENQLVVFPNPGDNLFTLKLSLMQADDTRIQVLDLLGRSYWEKRVRKPAGESTEPLPLGNLPGGRYFVRVETTRFTLVYPLLKR
ncbi:hypothetical protein GCM10023189_50340 [Nibrella saemangeumensis]|uniref:Secretion system C-terminal sorting domain-containing protein n=1 Tax=Nibrella saemangeumensis TaxID=1084526 RepID=A0ABP8NH45_9BACT